MKMIGICCADTSRELEEKLNSISIRRETLKVSVHDSKTSGSGVIFIAVYDYDRRDGI